MPKPFLSLPATFLCYQAWNGTLWSPIFNAKTSTLQHHASQSFRQDSNNLCTYLASISLEIKVDSNKHISWLQIKLYLAMPIYSDSDIDEAAGPSGPSTFFGRNRPLYSILGGHQGNPSISLLPFSHSQNSLAMRVSAINRSVQSITTFNNFFYIFIDGFEINFK